MYYLPHFEQNMMNFEYKNKFTFTDFLMPAITLCSEKPNEQI